MNRINVDKTESENLFKTDIMIYLVRIFCGFGGHSMGSAYTPSNCDMLQSLSTVKFQ